MILAIFAAFWNICYSYVPRMYVIYMSELYIGIYINHVVRILYLPINIILIYKEIYFCIFRFPRIHIIKMMLQTGLWGSTRLLWKQWKKGRFA